MVRRVHPFDGKFHRLSAPDCARFRIDSQQPFRPNSHIRKRLKLCILFKEIKVTHCFSPIIILTAAPSSRVHSKVISLYRILHLPANCWLGRNLSYKLIFILLRNVGPERLTWNGGKRRETAEIRVAAGPECEVGVNRYAYCRRKLLFALTFQRRRGELMCSWPVSDGFGIKTARFFGGIRGGSNKKSYC